MFKKFILFIIIIALLGINALAISQDRPKGWHVAVELEGGGLILVNFDYAKWSKVSRNDVILAKIRFQYDAKSNSEIRDIIVENINLINSQRKPTYPHRFNAGSGETTIYINRTDWSIKYSEIEIIFDPQNLRYVFIKEEIINTKNQIVQTTKYYDGILAIDENSDWRFMTSNQGLKAAMEYLQGYL